MPINLSMVYEAPFSNINEIIVRVAKDLRDSLGVFLPYVTNMSLKEVGIELTKKRVYEIGNGIKIDISSAISRLEEYHRLYSEKGCDNCINRERKFFFGAPDMSGSFCSILETKEDIPDGISSNERSPMIIKYSGKDSCEHNLPILKKSIEEILTEADANPVQ